MDNDRGIPEKGIHFAYRSIVSMIEEKDMRMNCMKNICSYITMNNVMKN